MSSGAPPQHAPPAPADRPTAPPTSPESPAGAAAEQATNAVYAMNPLAGPDRAQTLAAAGRILARSVVRPGPVARRSARMLGEAFSIAAGRSERSPEPSDKRFRDPTWSEHPGYRRWMQGYLAWREAILGLVDDLDLDWKSRERGRFALALLTEAAAPTNTFAGNPAALKRAFETAGASVGRGLRQLAHDLARNGGMPSQVDRTPFEPGRNVAVTPGSVVFRNEVLELLQYRPQTEEVHERPLVFVPPQVNKYYVLDLAPERSLMEFLVQKDVQTFAVSWRNPTPEQRDWDLDRYVGALLEAVDAITDITGSPDVNVLGACAGGLTAAVLAGHMAAKGDDRIHSLTFPVTVLDTSMPSPFSTLLSERTVASSLARSRRRGVLPGRDMARVFAWLRPNDLVWNYWVNNYLLGNKPPAFDILAWNNDATNLPAALHAEFLDLFVRNQLVEQGSLVVRDTPIDLSRVRSDVYAVGALTDHLTPWTAVYRTPSLFGGKGTFVLSSSGHIQALVNPPGNLKSRYSTREGGLELPPERWRESATEHAGSWWKHWIGWLAERSGQRRPAPKSEGSRRYRPLEPAPGRYVHQQA